MKLLVTGADGFTGRHFCEPAQAAGHEVVALRSDLTDADAVVAEVRATAPDHVLHLAGIAFVGHRHEEAFYAVNVVGTTNLLDALSQLPAPPARVLLASSANVYGNCAQSPIAETQAPAPVNHYAMSKLAMEQMARNYLDDMAVIVARPFNYTGPGQDEAFLIPKLAKHFAQRLPSVSLGNLHVEREFNDVRTVCNAYLALLEVGVPGETYNICSGRPHGLHEIIERFERLSGHRIDVKIDPNFVRENEVHRLCGSPDKLDRLLRAHGRVLNAPSLDDTLEQMLAAASAAS